jgi:hypothetical protein
MGVSQKTEISLYVPPVTYSSLDPFVFVWILILCVDLDIISTSIPSHGVAIHQRCHLRERPIQISDQVTN